MTYRERSTETCRARQLILSETAMPASPKDSQDRNLDPSSRDIVLNRMLLSRLPFLEPLYRDVTFGSSSPEAESAGNAYALTLGLWLRGEYPNVDSNEERLLKSFELCEHLADQTDDILVSDILYISVIENLLSAPLTEVRQYARLMGPLMLDAVLSMAMPDRYRFAIEKETGRSGTSAKVW